MQYSNMYPMVTEPLSDSCKSKYKDEHSLRKYFLEILKLLKSRVFNIQGYQPVKANMPFSNWLTNRIAY